MAADLNLHVPVLTDTVEPDGPLEVRSMSLTQHTPVVAATPAPAQPESRPDRQMLIAELQTQLAASTFELADRIMRSAFAEMEASIFEQISGRLRRELPEMIDELLRERLGDDSDY